ncbi:MAG: hypothetical protein FWD53_03505 [Phycisphaerales bacterium]|nr:hypothetical protein [Phycisphaerales bacterium]
MMRRDVRWVLLVLMGVLPLEVWGLSAITTPYVPQVEVSADGKVVATEAGGGKEDIALFDLQSGKLIRTLQVATEADWKVERERHEEQGLFYIRTQRWTGQLKFSGDGRYLVSTIRTSDANVVIFDMKDLNAKPMRIKWREHKYYNWHTLGFTSDSRHLVTHVHVYAKDDGSYPLDEGKKDYLLSWDVATGKENWRVDVSTHTVKPLVFRDDAVHVQSSDRWGKAMSRWFSAATGKEIAEPSPAAAAQVAVKQERPSDRVMEVLGKVKEVRGWWVVEGEKSGGKKVIAAVNNGLRVLDAVSGKVLFDLGDTTYHPPRSVFGP